MYSRGQDSQLYSVRVLRVHILTGVHLLGLMGYGCAPVADGDCNVESSLVHSDGVLRSGVRGQDSSAGMAATSRKIEVDLGRDAVRW